MTLASNIMEVANVAASNTVWPSMGFGRAARRRNPSGQQNIGGRIGQVSKCPKRAAYAARGLLRRSEAFENPDLNQIPGNCARNGQYPLQCATQGRIKRCADGLVQGGEKECHAALLERGPLLGFGGRLHFHAVKMHTGFRGRQGSRFAGSRRITMFGNRRRTCVCPGVSFSIGIGTTHRAQPACKTALARGIARPNGGLKRTRPTLAANKKFESPLRRVYIASCVNAPPKCAPCPGVSDVPFRSPSFRRRQAQRSRSFLDAVHGEPRLQEGAAPLRARQGHALLPR